MRAPARASSLFALLAVLALAGCGRVSYVPMDAGEMDSQPGRIDASGLDATPGLDAAAPDAPGLDARAPDDTATAPDVGAVTDAGDLDAALDGGPPGCRVRWTQRATGTSLNQVRGVFVADDGRIYASAGGNPPTVFAGDACSSCVVSFTRDGVRDLFQPLASDVLQVAAGPGAAASERRAGTNAFEIHRHTLGTFADEGALGAVSNDGSSSGRSLAVRGAAVAYEADLGGTITGATATPVAADDLAMALAYYEGGTRRWGRVIDGPGAQGALTLRILPDGDLGLFFRNLGTGPTCLDTGRCIARFRSGGIVLSRVDGSLVSLIETAVGVGSIVTDDRGVIAVDVPGGALERRDPSGALVWTRGLSASPAGMEIVHDAARGRVVLFMSIDGTSVFDGMPLRAATADGAGLALLELDEGTGALRSAIVFGSDGSDSANDLAIDAGGRIYLAAFVSGDVDLCAGGGGHGGMQDGLLIAID